MPDAENERILSGAIDKELLEEFDSALYGSIRPKPCKKKVMSAFAKWFISLTNEERNVFYKLSDEGISLNQWVNNRIHDYLQSAKGVVVLADAISKNQLKQKRTRQTRQTKQR